MRLLIWFKGYSVFFDKGELLFIIIMVIFIQLSFVIMRNTVDKWGESSGKSSIFASVLATTALAATLASCWWELNEINFDKDDQAVNFELSFTWWEYVHYDVSIKKENDSTYYWLIDGWFLWKKKEYRSNNPDKVFEEITDEVCESVSDAQLSSQESIYELEVKAQNKIKFIQKEYKKMLEENDWAVKDSTVVYKP